MRWFDWFAVFLIFAFAAGFSQFGNDAEPQQPQNPRRPPPNYQDQLWDQETRDWLGANGAGNESRVPWHVLPNLGEGIVQDDGQKKSSTGSAFSISDRGYWLTARHVAEGCTDIFLRISRGALRINRTILHPKADVALLMTDGGPKALPLAGGNGPSRIAYNVGFPAGQPGVVDADFIGEMTLRHRGRRGYRERVYAWAERRRFPNREGSLGGLSGGAVLNDNGEIIGVVQAESPRRGRIMTAQPARTKEVIAIANLTLPPPSGDSAGAITPSTFPAAARELILSMRVAKVFCRVE